MTKVPLYINSTALKTLGCEDKYIYTTVHGLKAFDNEYFRTGTILHKYAELRTLGVQPPQALVNLGLTGAEVTEQMPALSAFESLNQPPVARDKDGKPQVEMSFKIERDPIVFEGVTYVPTYVGHVDRVNTTTMGLEIVDYKSTRYYKLDDAKKAWSNSTQFIFYYTMLRQFAYDIFKIPEHAEHAWQGRMVFTPTFVMLSHKPIKWVRGEPYYPTTEQFEEFFENLERHVVPMLVRLNHFKSGGKTGWFSDQCPRCDFQSLCHARNDLDFERALKQYKQEPYNPLSWHS